MEATDGSELQWEAPGDGMWTYDRIHFPRPVPRAVQAALAAGMNRGLGDGFARYGQPLSTIDIRYVNDVMYSRGTMCDPAELERRATVAAAARAGQLWRHDVDRWYGAVRPERFRRNFELQACEPSSMTAAELAEHLRDLADNVEAGMYEHMELIGVDDTVGELLLAVEEWQLPSSDVLALLAGSSPGSRRAAQSLETIRALMGEAAIVSLAHARARGEHVSAAIDEHVGSFGWWVIDGYGPDGPTLAEHPDLLVRLLNGPAVPHLPDADEGLAALAGQLDADQRARFAGLVDDARVAYGVRDDNEGPTILWPVGLLRRGLLTAADRLLAAGMLERRDDVFMLDLTDLATLLTGGVAPGRDELAHRAAQWAAASAAPPSLGAPLPPPELDEAAAASLAAFDAAWSAQFAAPVDTGVGIGSTIYRGPVRVCVSAADAIDTLEPGDVLVTTATNSAFNMVLAMAGALITDFGGPTSHAALVARELGVPAIVGFEGATTRFVTGQVVEVDPVEGVVRTVDA